MSKNNKTYSIGVDVGGTKILTSLYDLNRHSIIGRKKEKTPKGGKPEEILRIIEESSNSLLCDSGIDKNKIHSMGIAIPGTVNPTKGLIGIAPNLGWKDISLAREAEKIFPWKVYIDNDVNMGLLGELQHPNFLKKDNQNLVYGIFCGTGIGGALAINGKIWHGAGFGAGEIGHIRISGSDEKCGCGQKGCLETKIGKDGIIRFLRENGKISKKSIFYETINDKKSRIKSSIVKKAFDSDEVSAKKLYKHYIKYLSIGIVNIINTINPNTIIIGGGMVESFGELFIEDIRKKVNETNIMKDRSNTEIILSQYKDDAGIIGAANVFTLLEP